ALPARPAGLTPTTRRLAGSPSNRQFRSGLVATISARVSPSARPLRMGRRLQPATIDDHPDLRVEIPSLRRVCTAASGGRRSRPGYGLVRRPWAGPANEP